MDSLDVNILKILNQDARTSFSEIARRLGHSITTISQRVKAMEDNGIIKSMPLSLTRRNAAMTLQRSSTLLYLRESLRKLRTR